MGYIMYSSTVVDIINRWCTYLSDFFLMMPKTFQKTKTVTALKVKMPRLTSISTIGSGTPSVIFPTTHLMPPPRPSRLHPPPFDAVVEVALEPVDDEADWTLKEPRTSLAVKREVKVEGHEKLKFPTMASWRYVRNNEGGMLVEFV